MAEGKISQVETAFRAAEELSNDLKGLPGIGDVARKTLIAANVRTTNQLLAKFYELERSEAQFSLYLRDLGIQKHLADTCALNFHLKLRNVP